MCVVLSESVGVAATLPAVVMVPASVVAGVVVERLGVRLCLMICTPVFSLTWVMIAQGANFNVLLIARMIQGVLGKSPSLLFSLSELLFY